MMKMQAQLVVAPTILSEIVGRKSVIPSDEREKRLEVERVRMQLEERLDQFGETLPDTPSGVLRAIGVEKVGF